VDIEFRSSSEVPLPPAEIRFRSLQIEPYSDRRRVRLLLELTPFQERPNVDIVFFDPAGEIAASAHIVEASEPKMSLTVHFRQVAQAGTYVARLILGYPDGEPADLAERGFEIGRASTDVGE
jgi:hypothetical protein